MTTAPLDQLRTALADRYRLERELGQGGMATVYLAHDVRHERKVAIKVLRPELAAVIGAERFVREIRTIAALQHPHILGLIDSGEVQGTAYYVMPFVEGESLRDRLVREKQLPIPDAVRIATEVGAALDYAHRHGIIHRDIKPENILLHDGSALVADFGIALAVSQAGGTRMTETGMSLGTPHYMSPEQAMGEREITARSDVYALAAVTYEMLTGDPPFTGSTAQAIVAKVLTEKPASIRQQRDRVPPAVEEAVLTALEKLPADRFATAGQFVEAFGRPAGTVTLLAPASARRKLGRGSAALLLAGGAAVAGVGILAGRWLPADRSGSRVTFVQKTFDDAAIVTARFAPDDKTIVYSTVDQSHVARLRIIRPEYAEPQRLGDDSTHLLAISSRGEMAVLTHARYLVHRVFTGTLGRMPLGSGVAREILADVREADWSPDGAELAVIRRVGDKDRLEYPVGHVILETDRWLTDVHVSPQGDRFAFFEHFDIGDDRGRVLVLDRKGKRTVVGPEYSGLEGLAWSKDGREVLFSAGELGEPLHLYRAVPGKTPVPTLPIPGSTILQAVSRTGQWLVTRETQPWRIWARLPGADADRDLSWLDRSDASMISGDGRWLAFSDQGQEAGNLYATMLRKTDGSAAVRLGDGMPVEISPDNRWILAMIPTSPTHYELFPTAAGSAVRLHWPQLQTIEWHPDFFPDSRSLLVCGAEAGRAKRCYKGSIDGEALEPVTPDSIVTWPYIGGSQLSPDGSAIVVRRDGHTMVWRLDGGQERVLPAIAPEDVVLRWSPDGKALWVTPVAVPIRIDKVDVATGRRDPLLTITPPERADVFELQWLSLADDPRVYAYNTGSWSSELHLVEGMQ